MIRRTCSASTRISSQPCKCESPSPPFRGEREGPARRVRWAVPRAGSSAPLTLPSPPGRRGERVSRCRFAGHCVENYRKPASIQSEVGDVARVLFQFAALDALDDVDQALVGAGGDADLRAFADDKAVEELDLGAPAFGHVLT